MAPAPTEVCSRFIALTAVLLAVVTAPASAQLSAPMASTTGSRHEHPGGSQGQHIARSTAPVTLPIAFEQRRTQFPGLDADVRFVGRGPSSTTLFSAGHATLLLRDRQGRALPLRLSFVGGRASEPAGVGTPAEVNYLVGPPASWKRYIPAFPRVRYADVYDGIDVAFYSTAGDLEFDLEVEPGADPTAARLRYEGHDRLELTPDGDLLIHTAAGPVLQRRPVAYQPAEGARRDPVRADYVLARSGEVAIALGAYDRARPLVIDPVLTRQFSTYLGGTADEAVFESGSELNIHGLIASVAGTIIVTGETQSDALASVTGTTIGTSAGYDAFIARIKDTGDVLLSLTFVGGTGDELQVSADADAVGNIYIGGRTTSSNLPVTPGAYQPACGGPAAGCVDGFVAKLTPAANALFFLTYLGGDGADAVSDIAVTPAGVLATTGTTSSSATTFPNTTPVVRPSPAQFDAFLTTFNTAGAVTASTFIAGATQFDHGFAVDFAPGGDLLVAGTISPEVPAVNFPAANFPALARGGTRDGFVARFSPDLVTLRYLAPFGGNGDEIARVFIDAAGRTYVYGATGSTDFVVFNQLAGQTVPAANQLRGYLMRLVWSGVQGQAPIVDYLVTLGNAGITQAFGAVPEINGNVWMAGYTTNTSFTIGPPTNLIAINVFPDALDTTISGEEGFLGRLVLPPVVNGVPQGGIVPHIDYGTFLGGTGKDAVINLARNRVGDLFVLGRTSSNVPPELLVGSSLPPGVVVQPSYAGGNNDMFVMRMRIDADGDGLPDPWEEEYGIPPGSTGDGGADGDPDGDGFTNLEELDAGTDPMLAQLYFAEGSLTSLGNGRFETRFSLFNPSPASDIDITLKFQPQGGPEIVDTFTIGPGARRTIDTSVQYPALNAYGGFSTVVEGRFPTLPPPGTPKYNVVAERQMTWARGGTVNGYSSHAETSIRQPATRWYLAEGSTLGTFELYYLLQNPGTTATTVSIRYVFPSGIPPCTVTKTVNALSRFTVYVNGDMQNICGVGKRDVSADITSATPIIVERAMYLEDGAGGRPFYYSGHESAGVLDPQASWLFAEGATGVFFDTYILVFNQEPVPLDIRLTFLRQGLPDVSVDRQIPANSRNTFALDVLREFGTGNGQSGNYVVPAEGGVSTVVDVLTPGRKVIAERAMWWPGPLSGSTGPGNPQPLWEEAHVSAGATRTSTLWAIADAEAQGPAVAETFALISNTSVVDTTARITVAFTDAIGNVSTYSYDQFIGAKRRFTIGFPSPNFGPAFDNPSVLKRFSVTIESLGIGGNPAGELVVERAHYSRDIPPSTPGAIVPAWPYWPAGSNNLATALR